MPKGRKPGKDSGNVMEIPSDTPVAEEIEETPEPEAAKPEQTIPVIDPDKGRRKTLTLFDRVRNIPKADWGTRAFIYVYCLEPICDLKMGGEKKYLVKSKEPIMDEDSIMMDYGSGKYRLQLVYRKPAADKADQIDTCEIEIYNPKYPPKIPQSVWMNDPRNARWLALIPKEEPMKPANALGSVTEAFDTFQNIRNKMAEEMKPPAENQPRSRDPFEIAKDIVAMKTGEDSSTVKLFEKQMEIMDRQNQAAQSRIDALDKELRDQLRAHNNPPAASVDPLDYLVKSADKLEPLLKRFMPQVAETAKEIVRGRRPGISELLVEQGLPILGQILTPFASLLASHMAASMTPTAPAQPMNGQVAPAHPQPQQLGQPAAFPSAAPVAPDQQTRFVQFLTQPLVLSAFNSHFTDFRNEKDADNTHGSDFAYWILKSGGEEPLKAARAMGTTNILNLFKNSPVWQVMSQHEVKLTAFLDQVLAYDPAVMAAGDDEDDDEEVTDLTAKG
jgi:hypothetical protein